MVKEERAVKKKSVVVVANRTNLFFEAKKGKECKLLKSLWRGGEGWYLLEDEDGKQFESPDIFWTEKTEG